MSPPSLLLIGLPWDHPIVAALGHDPEVIRKSLEANDAVLKDAGYEFKYVHASPDDQSSITAIINELKGRHWDGVVIDFVVRANPDMTPFFEMLVNTIVETSPSTKLLFNASPGSAIDAAKRQLPIS